VGKGPRYPRRAPGRRCGTGCVRFPGLRSNLVPKWAKSQEGMALVSPDDRWWFGKGQCSTGWRGMTSCGDPTDNHLGNLGYATKAENMSAAVQRGRPAGARWARAPEMAAHWMDTEPPLWFPSRNNAKEYDRSPP